MHRDSSVSALYTSQSDWFLHFKYSLTVSHWNPCYWSLPLFTFLHLGFKRCIFIFSFGMLTWFPLSLLSQANPADPRTFPFILLGNKIDVDGGNSRVVRIYSCSASMFLCSLHVGLSIVFPGFWEESKGVVCFKRQHPLLRDIS